MKAFLKRLLIGLVIVSTVTVIFSTGLIWLIAHDDVERLRAIAAETKRPLPPAVAHAILAAEEPIAFERPRLSVRWFLPLSEKIVSCGPAPIAFVLGRNNSRPRRAWRWHLENAVTTYVVAYSFTPDELLRIYAHEIYLGTRDGREILGVEAASRAYFGKDAHELTTAEAAMIAAMIRSPNRFSPVRDPARAMQRRNRVLEQMSQLRYIGERELQAALAEPL